MIMPCMKATSAGERCGRVARVAGGRVLLGCPGAPGWTTTGVLADSVCCACAGNKNEISGTHTDTSTQKIGAVARADQIFRLRRHTKSFTALRTRPFFDAHKLSRRSKKRDGEIRIDSEVIGEKRLKKKWRARGDSNARPCASEAHALSS